MAQAYEDLSRGRKRRGWKEEITNTLQQAGQDMGDVSEQEIAKKIRAYRREGKKQRR